MASAHIPEMHRPERTNGARSGPRPAKLRAIEGGQVAALPPVVSVVSVGDLLAPGSVALRLSASGKRQLLSVIAEMAARTSGVKASLTFDVLMHREASGSTGVGHGVAIPHARVPGLAKLRGIFLRLSTPVEFGAVDDRPVDLVFALLAPQECGSEHLRALSRVARLMRDPELRRQVRAVPSAAAIRALLVQEARHSAA